MGVVFSTLGTVLSWVGATVETLCLAVGEIASVLVRGVFTIIVGLCDVLAALMCCCRRPWHDRPSRYPYDGEYTTMLNVGGQQVLKNIGNQPIRNVQKDPNATESATSDSEAEEEKPITTPTELLPKIKDQAPAKSSKRSSWTLFKRKDSPAEKAASPATPAAA
ncbi:hypothetical protein OC846_000363 [Tilletia horrida]|uniref:Uncharacterized protein n=1 Tax=Tilletia horrida TaxID=155126 RepID=A0AAN6K0Y4_9BASI|nr:hypothetical protein OC845_000050 [Tilletia horrida]KAK0557575.1 hypothetical protein OC846_000363 [Tilletia horrida]